MVPSVWPALTTVYTHYATERAQQLTTQAKAAMANVPESVRNSATFQAKVKTETAAGQLDVQPYASTHGFWVASGTLIVGALLILAFITITHQDLQSDSASAGVHVG